MASQEMSLDQRTLLHAKHRVEHTTQILAKVKEGYLQQRNTCQTLARKFQESEAKVEQLTLENAAIRNDPDYRGERFAADNQRLRRDVAVLQRQLQELSEEGKQLKEDNKRLSSRKDGIQEEINRNRIERGAFRCLKENELQNQNLLAENERLKLERDQLQRQQREYQMQVKALETEFQESRESGKEHKRHFSDAYQEVVAENRQLRENVENFHQQILHHERNEESLREEIAHLCLVRNNLNLLLAEQAGESALDVTVDAPKVADSENHDQCRCEDEEQQQASGQLQSQTPKVDMTASTDDEAEDVLRPTKKKKVGQLIYIQ